jgi:hypothetical protein
MRVEYLCPTLMKMDTHPQYEIPPDCFQLEEVESLMSFEGSTLSDLNYYLWVAPPVDGIAKGFLFFLEMIFEQETLLLTAGEDSSAIRVGDAQTLVKTAERLQQLHGVAVIQRTNAAGTSLWKPLIGKTLQTVNLSRHASGKYQNDALVFDFGEEQRVMAWLDGREGLNLGVY